MKNGLKALRLQHEVGSVASLLQLPTPAIACYVFAHGAGAGMQLRYMETIVTGLAERGVATRRHQFPYMEAGFKRPNFPAVSHATVRAAAARSTLA